MLALEDKIAEERLKPAEHVSRAVPELVLPQQGFAILVGRGREKEEEV